MRSEHILCNIYSLDVQSLLLSLQNYIFLYNYYKEQDILFIEKDTQEFSHKREVEYKLKVKCLQGR